jgi:ATP-dependent RNA helicase RhlE
VARRNQTNDAITQKIHPVSRDLKKELLAHLIKSNDWHQVLVFTRMKHGANRLAEYLNKADISAMAIHGNKSQSARTKALSEFKTGDLKVLVATDIAARGIDIDQLPHVVNFELPNVPEDYVHRIGRTGRAGSRGEAISLVCVDENGFLRDIEKLTKNSIPQEIIAGFEPRANETPEPIVLGRMVIGEGAGKRGGGGSRRPSGAPAAHRPGGNSGRSGGAPAHHGKPPQRAAGGAGSGSPARPGPSRSAPSRSGGGSAQAASRPKWASSKG